MSERSRATDVLDDIEVMTVLEGPNAEALADLVREVRSDFERDRQALINLVEAPGETVSPLVSEPRARVVAEAVRLAGPDIDRRLGALDGALADVICASLADAVGHSPVCVRVADVFAFADARKGIVLDDYAKPVPLDLLEAMPPQSRPEQGAIAMIGRDADILRLGGADTVLTLARGGAAAAVAAIDIAKAMGPYTADGIEPIVNALSVGARTASDLRNRGAITAAVITLKGRGRTIGDVSAETLMRFGVSDWR